MMISGKNRIKSHMTLEYDFTGIRLLECSLIPVDWHVSVQVVALNPKKKSIEEAEFDSTIAYQKLFFWLDTNLPNVILVDVNSEDDLYLANLSSNIMLYCPGEPFDDVFIKLLHAKMVALSEGKLLIGEMELKGSDSTMKYSYALDEENYDLPETTKEYYTEGEARDSKPWWNRDDGFSFEFIRPPDVTISNEELFKDIVDPMIEFNRSIRDAADKHIGIVKEPARIVQVEKWIPKKV